MAFEKKYFVSCLHLLLINPKRVFCIAERWRLAASVQFKYNMKSGALTKEQCGSLSPTLSRQHQWQFKFAFHSLTYKVNSVNKLKQNIIYYLLRQKLLVCVTTCETSLSFFSLSFFFLLYTATLLNNNNKALYCYGSCDKVNKPNRLTLCQFSL